MKLMCDVCDNVLEMKYLVIISPELTGDILDLKRGYEDFDGMVCQDCFNKINIG